MPNGGPDNCGTCKFYAANNNSIGNRELNYCSIRNINIRKPFWTYCANWRQYGMKGVNPYGHYFGKVPYGPVYSSGIYEGYVRIPWNGAYEPNVYVSGRCELCGKYFVGGISIYDGKSNKYFCTNSHYVEWWKQENRGVPLLFDYKYELNEGDNPTNLHKIYTEIYRSGYLVVDFIHMGENKIIPNGPIDSDLLLGKIQGTLIGGGIGDSLGCKSEGLKPGTYWTERYDDSPNRHKYYQGMVTDDTQLTMWLAESLLENDGLNPDELARKFTCNHIRGIGSATKDFIRNYKDKKLPWYKSGVDSAGNGVAMRSGPIGIYFRDNFDDLKLAAGIQALVTHNNSMAIASGIITSYIIARLLKMNPSELGNIESRIEFCRDASEAIKGIECDKEYRTRSTSELDTLYQRIYYKIPEYLSMGKDPKEVSNIFWNGGYVLESLTFAFYCFLYSPEDFRKTLLNAVNYSVDSDTVGAIACSFSGALNGINSIGKYYIEKLEYKDELVRLSIGLANRK